MRDICRATRKQHSAEEKIRIVLDGLRGEVTIAELCRREGIAESLYYSWSKEFLEAGKRRLAGDTARSATTSEVKDLKRQALELLCTTINPEDGSSAPLHFAHKQWLSPHQPGSDAFLLQFFGRTRSAHQSEPPRGGSRW